MKRCNDCVDPLVSCSGHLCWGTRASLVMKDSHWHIWQREYTQRRYNEGRDDRTQNASSVCISALHFVRCWVMMTLTCAVKGSPTQPWMETVIIFRRRAGEESKVSRDFIILSICTLSTCNLIVKKQRQKIYSS